MLAVAKLQMYVSNCSGLLLPNILQLGGSNG